MKATGIALAVILIFVLYKYLTRKKVPADFLTIRDGRFNRLVLKPGITKENFDALLTEYADKKYHPQDNLFYKLSDLLPDTEHGRADYADFFAQLNQSQRIYTIMLQMDAQINNGGVYQFLWNWPEMVYAAGEALQELGVDPLNQHFAGVLKELESNAAGFIRDKQVWNDPGKPFEEKWKIFQQGRAYIPTGESIEAYFYTDAFAEHFHGKMVAYIQAHRTSFGIPF